MRIRFDSSAAILSLLYPGWGQLAQGRRALGWLHFAWATLALLALFLAPALGVPVIASAIDLALVTVWSVLDAAMRQTPRAA